MYTFKTYDDIDDVSMIFEEPEKKLLGDFISDYDVSYFCELYRAAEMIKEGTLDRYGLAMDLYIFSITKPEVVIIYYDTYDRIKRKYDIDEFIEAMDAYSEKVKELYDWDIREVNEDYVPLIEGIIDEKNIINDDIKKRFP